MPSINSPTPDATTASKGKLALAGDLGGTAATPLVTGITVKRQNDTTNSTISGSRMETGWGAMTFASAATSISETVTFSTSFTSIPIVTVSFGGDQVSGTVAYGNGGNNVHLQADAKPVSITNAGFTVYVFQSFNSSWNIGNIVYYQWTAVGL